MKKLSLIFRMSLFAALMATWSSCSKSSDVVDPNDNPPTDPYMEVCQHVADVANAVKVFYDKSENLAEMAEYIDEIKNLPYVEDAYASGCELFVRIKDYGKISYSFFPKLSKNEEKELYHAIVNNKKRLRASQQHVSQPNMIEPKIAFVSQVQFDESEGIPYQQERLSDTREMFDIFGFNVPDVGLIAPTVDFFQNGLFEYDIVYLITHGGFDKYDGTHAWLTSEGLNNAVHHENYKGEDFYTYKEVSPDLVYYTTHKEVRDGKIEDCVYAVVTEKWIKESDKFFTNQGSAIVFNGCCLSMCGPNPEGEENPDWKDSISSSVAKIFTEKGAGVYFGYDESNYVGVAAGVTFLHKLFSGMSVERAYEDLPFELRHNCIVDSYFWGLYKNRTWADLIPYYNKNYPNFGNYCIWSPFFNIKHDYQVSDKDYVVLSGNAYYSNTYYNYSEEKDDITIELSNRIPNDSPVRYGFYISETPSLTDAIKVCQLGAACYEGFEQVEYNDKYYNVSFKYQIPEEQLKSSTRYYYWAYFFDGKEYYYSEMFSFTPRTVIPDIPGTDF